MSAPLWQPSQDRIARADVTRFLDDLEDDWNVTVRDFRALYAFSVADKEKFWQSLRDFAGLAAETWGEVVLADADRMPGARWFPDARLNIAENMLRRRDDADAIVFWGEGGVRRRLS